MKPKSPGAPAGNGRAAGSITMLSTAEQLTPDVCQNRLRITMPDKAAGSADSPVEVLAW